MTDSNAGKVLTVQPLHQGGSQQQQRQEHAGGGAEAQHITGGKPLVLQPARTHGSVSNEGGQPAGRHSLNDTDDAKPVYPGWIQCEGHPQKSHLWKASFSLNGGASMPGITNARLPGYGCSRGEPGQPLSLQSRTGGAALAARAGWIGLRVAAIRELLCSESNEAGAAEGPPDSRGSDSLRRWSRPSASRSQAIMSSRSG